MAKRHFLQKATVLDIERHMTGGKLWSEKLNGMRCFWDGGVSRGILKSKVPWANTDKDDRFNIPPVATGLWTHYCNVIHAPDAWLDLLPKIPLDGELYCPGLSLQKIMSIVKQLVPVRYDWMKYIGYHIFDIPSIEIVLATGRIHNPNINVHISWTECKKFIDNYTYDTYPMPNWAYWKSKLFIERICFEHPILRAIIQEELPQAQLYALNFLKDKLEKITDAGGEGIIIRHPDMPYICERTKWVLKMKKYLDAEGIVVGYTTGREGKLQGLMGNLILRLENGRDLEISGFTDTERRLINNDGSLEPAFQWAYDHPDVRCPNPISCVQFPIGTKVNFRYRDLTDDGIPVEAHYHRIREEE